MNKAIQYLILYILNYNIFVKSLSCYVLFILYFIYPLSVALVNLMKVLDGASLPVSSAG